MDLDPTLYMVVVFVVLLSSVLWLFLGIIQDEYSIWLRLVMTIVGVLAIFLMSQRDFYLPFLGNTAFPIGLLNPSEEHKGNVHFKLANLPPNSKVIFWAAMPQHNNSHNQGNPSSWKTAYGDYVNGGVAVSDAKGVAMISFDCPQSYEVGRLGFKHLIPKHVHYRYQLSHKHGIMSRVFTEKVSCEL